MLAWHLGMRILRRRRSAWLALAAVCLSVAVPVLVMGVMQGWIEVTRLQVRAYESDLTLEPGRSYALVESSERLARLTASPDIAAAAPFVTSAAIMTPRTSLNARITLDDRANRNIPCMVEGVDWRLDGKLGRRRPEHLHPRPALDLDAPPLGPEERGTGFLTPQWRAHLAARGLDVAAGLGLVPLPIPPDYTPTAGAVVGRELIYSHHSAEASLMPGHDIQLVVPNGTGGLTGKVILEVSDTLGTGVIQIDRMQVMVPLAVAQQLTDMDGGRKGERPREINGYRVRVADGADWRAVGASLAEEDYRVQHWKQRRPNTVEFLQVQRNIIGLVMIAIQCISVFIIYAVFSTMVVEKRHDIGTLLGIGARPRSVAAAFLLAGLTVCLIGGALGWALGWGLLALINPFGDWTGVDLFPQNVIYTPDAPISWNPWLPVFFIAVILVVGLIATLGPAIRAARVDPVVTLRENG